MQNLVIRARFLGTQVVAKLALDRVIVLGVLAAYILPLLGATSFTGGFINAAILGVLITYGSLVCLVPVALFQLVIDGMFKLCRSRRRSADFHIGDLSLAAINLFVVMAITLTVLSLLPFTMFACRGLASIIGVALLFSILIEWMNGKVRPHNHHSR